MSIRIGLVNLAGLIGTILFLLVVSSAVPAEPAKRLPARIAYCDNADYPPFSMIDSKGRPAGFNIDLIKAIGREIGIQFDVRLLPWKQARSALETERSAEVSAMFYSAERDRIFDFAVPLATEVYQVFQRHGSQDADPLAKLNGKQVLVEDRSYAAEYLSANRPEIQLLPVGSESEALRLLSLGKADAAVATQSGGFYAIAREGYKNIFPADFPVLPVSYSFVVPDGNSELMNELNRGLARVKTSGEYVRIYNKWFGPTPPGISKGVPWRYVTAGSALLLVLTGCILFWIWSLRRQVAEKTGRLSAELAERERVERSLRESEAKLQTILDHSTALVFLKDLDGRYLLVNRMFEEHIGKKESEIIGRTDLELHPPELAQLYRENDRKALDADVPMAFEEKSEFSGAGRTFLTTKFPIRDTNGAVKALGGVGTDITDRKRFEQEIQAAREAAERASQSKDHFLAVLSHELRTPLTPVLAAVTEALSSDVPHEMRSMLEMIQRNIELESRLIEDLLDLTRLARGKLTLNFRTLNAHELVQEAAAICSSGLAAKKQEVRFELDAEHPYINADAARMQQVIWNLIQNAIKFSPAGSEIVIRSFNSDDGQLVIQCIDRGVGMGRDVLSRVFLPFEQAESSLSRRYGGLGLGLAISRMIIEAHHGEIFADSPGPGQGSTLTIALTSVPRPKIEKTIPRAEAPTERAEQLRILLVEDSEDTRRVLAKLLRAKGHEVVTAENVADAKQLWFEQRFDLLLSDIGLPDATGLELAAELRSAGPLRAVAFSGFGSEEDVRRSKDAGFSEHLVKPLDINQLKQAVARVMSRSPMRGN
ncbi:transporter substrate-binding domain-containing protein [Verrucomicrobiota bacterium sgz303538]